jgi:hypothetical protein
MKHSGPRRGRRSHLATPSLVAFLLLLIPSAAFAQRELHWAAIEVSAHLDALGTLRVIETQTMVFTGAWNGGERRFRIQPRQKFFFEGLYRGLNSGWQRLTEDSRLDDVDEYAWADPRTLRWRSRQRSDPPFNNTVLRYELRYRLSGILLKQSNDYRLNHDFAFPDRSGTIHRFVLRFTHDADWQPRSEIRKVYTAGPLPPGQSFVLNLPLHYTGSQVPAILDLSRSREIVIAVSVLIGVTALAIVWFFVREQSHGRFAPLATAQVDEVWLREHILKHPAEVIGAAWDGSIGTPEVVALIARMVGEGKLESQVEGEGRHSSMTLRLKVDRSTLEGQERTLVTWLFFDGRTDTSTELVKEHYSDVGFNPVNEIRPELEASVRQLLPEGDTPRSFRFESVVLFIMGIGALLFAWFLGVFSPTGTVLLGLAGALVLAAIGWMAGVVFRAQIDWGRRAALLCLAPAMILAAATAVFLWFYVGTDAVDLPAEALFGIVAVTLALTNASINALRSRQSRGAIALRKTLATGREFFVSELRKDRPALRDEWFPWALAFGLGGAVDDWSVRQSRKTTEADRRTFTDPSIPASSSESVAPSAPWTGFGGGRSGGAGASASWTAAAGGIAAGVSVPKSHGSSGGSESDSSDSSDSSVSSSSSESSSGGGGGGGW